MEALEEAASELLAERGPRQLSVRDVATRAGVNHGQVHHYYGGKEGLLVAAMRRTVLAHRDAVHEHRRSEADRDIVDPNPWLTVMLHEDRYRQSLLRCLLDEREDLARLEIDEDCSIGRDTYLEAVDRLGDRFAPDVLAGGAAVMMALTIGWSVLEPLMQEMFDLDTPEIQSSARAHLSEVVRFGGYGTPPAPRVDDT